MGFAHLHVHTHYSFLQGALRIKDLCVRAKEAGMSAVAITDRGNLYGAIEFQKVAKEVGIRPIFGAEVFVVGNRADPTEKRPTSLVLLAETEKGYKNLIGLVSQGWLQGYQNDTPRVDRSLIAAHKEGLIALSGGLAGDVGQAVLRRELDAAEKLAQGWLDLFGPEHYYLQVERLGFAENKRVTDATFGLGSELGIGCVATNYVHYPRQDDARAHAALVCVGLGKSFAALGSDIPNELYVQSEAQMRTRFADHPESVDLAGAIAERCQVKIPTGKNYLPRFVTPNDEDLPTYLRLQSQLGLEKRFDEAAAQGRVLDRDAYFARLEVELNVIIPMDFSGYFLIVWDFIRAARDMDCPVGPGRGSGAGSLVAYSLRITDIDPLLYGLLFERFLNPERVSMPDFDIDFCMNKRDRVIRYVTQRYGKNNVGQIITYGQLRARAAIKDIGRVFDMSFAEVDRLAKLIPEELGIKLADAYSKEPRIEELFEEEPRYRELWDVALRVEGLTRQAGLHAAGIVISEEPLWHYVPVCLGANGEYVTQFAKEEVELAGLVKFDFLGLKTLTVIDQAVRLINDGRTARKEPPFDLNAIPLADKPVFDLLAAGNTTGVFQLESSGFKDLMKKLRPTSLEDVIAAVALYRPGPIGTGMVDDFVKRKHGEAEVDYLHPSLEGVLKETYGVIVYQEQVMTIARVIGGYSLGGADILRRAMGKKKAEEMAKQKSIFLDGAANTGVASQEDADRIFELMAYFAGYGFNKSHSAAYALITYQTAYLKAHHPVEFYAALMTCDGDNTEKVVRMIGDARGHGIVVRPPDVNLSEKDFSVDGGGVRFGLGAIKMVGEGAVDAIVEGRAEGHFKSLFDFCERVDLKRVGRRTVEQLIRSGACDGFAQERHVLFHNLERAIERAQSAARDRASGQGNLFALFGGGKSTEVVAASYAMDGEPWVERARLEFEKEAIGFYVSGHPLDRFEHELNSARAISIAALMEGRFEPRDTIGIGCIVVSLRERVTKSGDGRMGFAVLEDQSGQIEAMFFTKSFAVSEEALKSNEPLVVHGAARYEGEGEGKVLKFRAEKATKLVDIRRQKTRRIGFIIDGVKTRPETVAQLVESFRAHPGDVPVTLLVDVAGLGRAVIEPGGGLSVSPTDDLISAAERLLGRNSVRTAF